MWNLKYGTSDPIYKTETGHEHEGRLVVARGRGRGREGDEWGIWVNRCKLLNLE